MIPVPSDVRVWLAVGRTDMRRGMNGLALQVQEALGRDPFVGDLFVFRGARGDLIKILWHDGLGLSLYAKRLERGRFVSYDHCQHATDDAAGAGCAALEPLLRRIEAHVLAAERLHGDDTTVPVLAKGKTHTSRCWVYVRDDRPFGGGAPPAAMFYYSRDRGGAHVEAHLTRWSGLLQADAYSGYSKLYVADRIPGPILEAACWAHARRPFFAFADIEASARRKAEGKAPAPISPLALEIVQRMDRLFEIERGINGKTADERRAVRQELSRPLVAELEARMRAERPKLSRGNDLAKAMDYMLKRWPAFTRFLDDGRVCLSNNAAERALRGIALGRKSWLFAGSDRGGTRAAAMYSLIVTAKMNDIDPQAWLADVLARIAEHPALRIDELLPWNWRTANAPVSKAA